MATHTLTEKVHVDIRVDGETISTDFGPGDVTLPPAVAELLIAQGIAAPITKASKKTSAPAAAETPTPTEPSEA